MVRTHDVLVQHLRIRVGDGLGPNPDTRDGISIDANSQEVYNVVIDHCSISWAIDENLSFAHGTHNATVMNSIISEGLHNSLHSEGPHSKGIIVARAQNIAIINNIMAHNYDRNPILGKAENGFDVTAAVANNVMYDWGNQATVINESLEDTTVKLGSVVGNVYLSGNSTRDPDPITVTAHPNTQLYFDDNTNNRVLPSDPWDLVEGDDGQITRVSSPPVWPNGFTARDVTEVESYVLANAGARPADKDAVEGRIIDDVQLATGSIIDSQDEVGGWPFLAQNTRVLTLPADPNNDDDGDGYTNLEEWLHNYAASVEPIPGAPFVPRLLSPSHGATSQPTSLTLQWNASLGATTYRFQLATDSTFMTGLVVDDFAVTDTLRVDSLSSFTRFFWRVRAENGAGSSAFSAARKFTTVIGAPKLSSPADGATEQDTSLTLQWNPSVAAASYHLQLAMDSGFTSLAVDDSALTDTSRQVNGLSRLTSYFWRVRARNVEGMSAYSFIWRFTTVPSAPSSPTLVSPLDGATNQSVTPILRWNMVTGASTYRLEVATDSNFVLVLNDSSLVDTFRVSSQLENDTKHYWRVNANNVGGSGPWSDSWSFTTIVRFPSQVTLVSPANGAEIAADTARFLWHWSEPAVSRYWFEKAVDSLFVNADIDSTLSDTANVVRNLLNGTHWWKVRAYNAAGWGPFSEARQFSVITTDVNADQELPREFSLSQNYPNPFNPSTVIGYALPHNSRVHFAIYNMLGQRVALLVDDDKVAGYHRVMFSNPGLGSGVYLYRLNAGHFSATKKLVLLK
jgi:hypothetical protein